MKAKNDWHLLTDSEALEKLSVDMYRGLDEREVRKRRGIYGRNSIWKVPKRYTLRDIFAAVFDIATLLLVVSIICAAVFDKNYEAGWLAAILVAGACVRTITFVRAENILYNAARTKIPSVSVIRNGKLKIISADEVVPGDIIFLEAGDTVPCDGRVIADATATVTEKGITENKTPLKKFNSHIKLAEGSHDVPCEFRSNMLFAGSTVLYGRIRMLAVATGDETLAVMKQGGIEIKTETAPEIERLRERSRTVSLVMLGFVMLLTFLSMLINKNTSLPSVFLSSLSMAVAAMSEFLIVIGYIIFSVAIRDCGDASHMSHKNKKHSRAVIRNVEKLGGLSSAKRIVFCTSSFFKSGEAVISACRAGGKYFEGNEIAGKAEVERLIDYAGAASLKMNNGLTDSGSEKSITNSEKLVGLANDAYVKLSGKNITSECVLADHRGRETDDSMGMETSLVLLDNDLYAVSCGNIDDVMKCCTMIEDENGVLPLDNELKKKIFTECAKLQISGGRVLAVAKRQSQFPSLVHLPVLIQYMTFVGYFVVSEKEEDCARENIAYIKNTGMPHVLFTENTQEDYYYLRKLGLFDKHTKIVRYGDLTEENITDSMVVSFDGLSEREYASCAAAVMKKLGDKTITIGKKVWDSGAMAESEYGITVVSGMKNIPETLAKNSDAVVYSESKNSYGGLDGIVRVFKTSKRVLSDIASAEFYFTASNTVRVVLMVTSVLFGVGTLSPVFILVWGLLFDFAAVLVMAFGDSFAEIKANGAVSALFGALLGIVLAFTDYGVMLFTKSSSESAAVLAGAIILAGLALTELALKPKIKLSAYNNSDLLFILSSAVLASVLMLTEIGARICSSGTDAAGVSALFAFVPALILSVSCLIYKAVIGRKNKSVSDNKSA